MIILDILSDTDQMNENCQSIQEQSSTESRLLSDDQRRIYELQKKGPKMQALKPSSIRKERYQEKNRRSMKIRFHQTIFRCRIKKPEGS